MPELATILPPLAAFGGLLALIALVWFLKLRGAKRAAEAWKRNAASLGLEHRPKGSTPGRIEGRYQERKVRVMASWGHKGAARVYVHTELKRALGLGLHIHRGGGGIATGDASFDKKYLVRADDEEHARSLLGEELRALFDSEEILVLTDQDVRSTLFSFDLPEERLRALLELHARIAELLER